MTQDPNRAEVGAADAALLHRAIEISAAAVRHGNHPFGALLTDPSGAVALTAENTVLTERDVTGHAETNLVRLAARDHPASELLGWTLYTSCEPCAMCAGAIYWAGVGRVVYAMSEADLAELTGAHDANPTLTHPCRSVFADGRRATCVAGPADPGVVAAARAIHAGFW